MTSGKGKTMETVKRPVAAGAVGGDGEMDEETEHRGLLVQ